MANSVITQRPKFTVVPVGFEMIFVVSNNTAVIGESRVKFIADVHIGTTQPNLATTTDLIGSFKTTPNAAGVGMFDLRTVVETYVSSDNLATNTSSYKGQATTDFETHPVHLIDKYSNIRNSARFLAIRFSVEYLGATDAAGNQDANVVRRQVGTEDDSINYLVFNGYIKNNDFIFRGTPGGLVSSPNANFGFQTNVFFPGIAARRWLTNAPTTQYATLEDYGTLAFMNTGANDFQLTFTYYNSSGVAISTPDIIERNASNGSYNAWSQDSSKRINYVGVYPGNLQNWSTNFATAMGLGLAYYTVIATSLATSTQLLETYTIYIDDPANGIFALIGGTSSRAFCPPCTSCSTTGTEGRYDSIESNNVRLCWLNQWGAWDYFTFSQKAVKSLSNSSSTFTQLEGTWNDSAYHINGFKGGKRKLRVNTTETVTVNSAFVSEGFNVMFEELMNSPEVYLLRGFETVTIPSDGLMKYVVPVRLTTSSFTRKTIANDRLIQYTFDVEKSRTLRTQAI
jgi:hypothetical protein